jgi:hypothetical protein
MSDEFEKTWTEEEMTQSRQQPGMSMKNFCHDSQCPARASNQELPKYNFTALPLDQPVRSHSLLLSTIDGGEWSASRSGRSISEKSRISDEQDIQKAPEPIWTLLRRGKSLPLWEYNHDFSVVKPADSTVTATPDQ